AADSDALSLPDALPIFKGIYNIFEKNINLFSGNSKKNIEETIAFDDIQSPELEKLIGSKHAAELRDNLDLVHGVYPEFDKESYQDRKSTRLNSSHVKIS